MRMNLKVPFAEKDEAKKLGARWDAARKVWYVEDDAKLALFAKWSPVPQSGAAGGEAKVSPAAKPLATGKFITGSAYVEVARVCDCLPWEVCAKCQATALKVSSGEAA